MKTKNKKIKNRSSRRISGFFLGEEKDYFVENVAMLLGSGTSISAALSSIRVEVQSRPMKKMVGFLEEDIENGVPLWRALENTGIMSESTISLIRVGEQTGRLPENLRIIGVQQQKERSFQSKIRSAMLYPALVLGLTLVIGVGISWFILPRLATVFSQLKIDLPWITKVLISFGTFLSQYGIIAVPSMLIGVGLLIYVLFFAHKTRFIGQAILLSFVGIRKLIQNIELARFGYILGTLLNAGLPLIDALKSVEHSSTLVAYQKFYSLLRKNIEEGNSFRDSFKLIKKSEYRIPTPIQEMIGSAERSGRLSETLISIGAIFEEKVDTATKNVATLIEPFLLVIVWLGVMAVALAVILPIYSLVGGLETGPNQSLPQKNEEVMTEEMTNQEPVYLENEENLEDQQVTEDDTEIVLEDKSIIQLISTGFVNIREEPTAASPARGKAYPGERYELIGEQDGWMEIKIDEQKNGWILGSFAQSVSSE